MGIVPVPLLKRSLFYVLPTIIFILAKIYNGWPGFNVETVLLRYASDVDATASAAAAADCLLDNF